MTQVTWQVFVAMLLVIVTVIALLIRATSKNPARWRIQPAAADELFLDYPRVRQRSRQPGHPRTEGSPQ
jgi:hypothetical protein